MKAFLATILTASLLCGAAASQQPPPPRPAPAERAPKAPPKAAPAPPPSVTARTIVGVERFEEIVERWMADTGVQRATLSVMREGKLVFDRGFGDADPAKPVLLASLSKAITGACVARLVEDGKLGFDMPLGVALADWFKAHGDPADPRTKSITVGQALTHRGGFAAAPRDLMTPPALDLLEKRKSPGTATLSDLLQATLQQPLAAEPGSTFAYSNVGYLALGVAIEQASGEPYFDYCGREVLQRAGIKQPRLDQKWFAFAPFGAWMLSGAEYLAFVDWLEPGPATLIGPKARVWQSDPVGKASDATIAPDRPGAWYGLGRNLLARPGGSTYAWHAGTWRDETGLGYALLAFSDGFGMSMMLTFSPAPARPQRDQLEADLGRAALRDVRRWPDEDLFVARGLR